MESFYKSKFEREQNRRNQLDDAINYPVIGITVAVTLNSFIISQYSFDSSYISTIIIGILTLSSLSIGISLIFLFISFNNLFTGFNYENFGLLKDYRKYEKELEKYNSNLSEHEIEITFEKHIVDKLIQFSDNHTIINDKRGLFLYRSKTFIIVGILLTMINVSLTSYNSLKMDDDNKPVNVPAPSENPRPEPPRSPIDRIEKSEDPSIPNRVR